jgi:hypothetical protein
MFLSCLGPTLLLVVHLPWPLDREQGEFAFLLIRLAFLRISRPPRGPRPWRGAQGLGKQPNQELFQLGNAFEVFLVQGVDLRLLELSLGLSAVSCNTSYGCDARSFLGIERGRHPEANLRLNEIEARRHHADGGERPSADAQTTPKSRFVSAVQLPPKPVTEDHFLVPPDFPFIFLKRAAQHRRNAQQVEPGRRHLHSANLLRRAILGPRNPPCKKSVQQYDCIGFFHRVSRGT